MEPYLLPSHPHLTCTDPLSFVDKENPTVWDAVTAHIASFKASPANSLTNLPDLIENLAYTLHGNGKLDTVFLRRFIGHTFQAFTPDAEHVLKNVLEAVLVLPLLFPSHSIHQLSLHNPLVILSTWQVRSLVAHQLLGTLQPPQGNSWGPNLSCWYSSPQPLENAVNGYLATLFHYFKERGDQSSFVRFEFCSDLAADASYHAFQSCRNLAFGNLMLKPVGITTIPFPHETIDCTVISSNACPGFGPACTQEELITAACPELLPVGALLISVPVPSDGAILVRNVIPASRWTGQGRHARLIQTQKGRPHDFLLVDAAELDVNSAPLPDLLPAILQRDLIKLLVGFSALRRNSISKATSPLWGAGSFGGDPIIKAIIIALAAAFAGFKISLTVDEDQTAPNGESDTRVLDVLRDLKSRCQTMTVQEALSVLKADQSQDFRNGWDIAQEMYGMVHGTCRLEIT